MPTTSAAAIIALRSEIASLRSRLSIYENGHHSGAPKQASIEDLVSVGIVVESITDALFGLNDEWRFAYLNLEAERLLGRGDLAGKNIWQEFPEAIGSLFDVEYHRAREARVKVYFESFYPPLDAWFEVRAYPLSDGLAVYFRDVSERKRAQRDLERGRTELKTILDSVPVIVSSIGPDGRFRQLNQRFQEVFRRDPEWAIGRTLAEVVGEPHVSLARPFVERAMKGEAVQFESMVRNHEGELRNLRVFYVPQRTPDGDSDGLIAMVEDVTERKRTELALRDSENRFRTLFQAAPTGMALCSYPQGMVLRANQRFADFLGFDPDELLGMSLANFTPLNDLSGTSSALGEPITGAVIAYQVERRYVRKDGSIVWGQTSGSILHDTGGIPSETLVVVEDVTDRKRSEDALRDSENRLRTLAESLPQLVWTSLPDGRCDYLSTQWVAYTGVPEKEQLGLRWLDLVMHPEDREPTYRAWMAAVRDEAPYDLEYRLRRYDGQYRWFKTRGAPMRDAFGQIIRWFGTCTDIHDQREAEEERRRALEREQEARALAEVLNGIGPMLLTELDTERLIQKVTDLATELIGAEFGAFFHNLIDSKGEGHMLYALSGASRESFERFPMPSNDEVFAPAFAGQGVVLSDNIAADSRYANDRPSYRETEGHLPVVSYLAVPVVSRAGEVIGGLFFSHSQTGVFRNQHARLMEGIAAQAAIALDNARLFAEVQKSEEALRASNDELRQANADLEQFAYAAAHDLQEPLRMVTSYTQLLERSLAKKLDERTRTFMQYIVGGASRMSLLLQDLLAYTETSRRPDGDERVSLNRVLQQAIRNLQPAITEARAQIIQGDLPSVMGRESQFLQLFQNLLSNAVKYRQRDISPCIEISSELQGDHSLIRVRDNGMGIDAAYHRQVFGVFKRLHGSEIPGTGIGLAICQRVVERAGGQIWVESELGQGCTFAFTLPVAPDRS